MAEPLPDPTRGEDGLSALGRAAHRQRARMLRGDTIARRDLAARMDAVLRHDQTGIPTLTEAHREATAREPDPR